jgi:hypothetical protein
LSVDTLLGFGLALFLPLPMIFANISGRHSRRCRCFLLLLRSLLFGLVLCLFSLLRVFREVNWLVVVVWVFVAYMYGTCWAYEASCDSGVYMRLAAECPVQAGSILLAPASFSLDSCCIWPRNFSAGRTPFAFHALVWAMVTQTNSCWW